MTFSLANAPAIFQSFIHKYLVEKIDIFWIRYLDNILIYKNKKENKCDEKIK